MNLKLLRKKLENLRRLELSLSHHGATFPAQNLIWSRFFSMARKDRVRYPLSFIALLDHAGRKEIFEEFLYDVFLHYFQGPSTCIDGLLDPSVLDYFGLPLDASCADVKRKFKELAKLYHPDRGGSHEKMTELLDVYGKGKGKGR